MLLEAAAAVAFSVNAASRDDAGSVVQKLLTPATMTELATAIQPLFPGVKAADLSIEMPPSVMSGAAVTTAAAAACVAAMMITALLL